MFVDLLLGLNGLCSVSNSVSDISLTAFPCSGWNLGRSDNSGMARVGAVPKAIVPSRRRIGASRRIELGPERFEGSC